MVCSRLGQTERALTSPRIPCPSALGCDFGCGHAASSFGNYTSVASHEMVETMNAPEVGIAQFLATPLAWYDNSPGNGEIGDICNGRKGSIAGGDGVVYVVQKEWSNKA